MKINSQLNKQITFTLKNQKGLYARLLKLLADEDINLQALDCHPLNTNEMLCSLLVEEQDLDMALNLLRTENLQPQEREALLVTLPDQPGASALVLETLNGAGIEVEQLSSTNLNQTPTLILATQDNQRACQVLA